MEIIDNTALRISVPQPIISQVLNRIEKSEQLGNDLLLYWGFDEVSYLTRLLDEERPNNILVPSPIYRDYSWPTVFPSIFKHQKTTASYLSLRKRVFCFSEAGTAKTASAVWASDYLMNLGLVKRVLIICPLSIMYSAWQADIFQTAMHRSVAVAHGESDKRKKIISGTYDFVIINYDGVGIVRDEISSARFDLIIIDEANAYKKTNTQRWKTLARLITPDTRIWMMTGTPAAQSPVDAFGLAKIIAPHRVPKFSTAWRDAVMVQLTRFKWVPKSDSKNRVFHALQPAIRFTKKECLDLPPVLYESREIPLTVQAAKYYRKLKQELLIEAAGEEISAVNAAASMNKLLQISGGAVYTDKHDVVEFDIKPRLDELLRVLDETEHKVLVYVPYTHTIEVVKRTLISEGISAEVIQGGVSPKERTDIVNKFQNQSDPRILILQPQAAAHGLTLTAADTVIFFSPVMSVDTFIQCVGRIDRVGQVNNMTVYLFYGSDIEKKVYKMLTNKVNAHKSIVEMYKEVLEEA
jgi:SNF2 family DNA or RNA helicase